MQVTMLVAVLYMINEVRKAKAETKAVQDAYQITRKGDPVDNDKH